ncbi:MULTISPECIES: hypothetical protein [Rhizobium]|uniref:hypothetical protein n=1 Tax=Rhizobium TaxID=379 RepID=UPI0007EA40A7|nr:MULTISPECIES: hypothetical protein [Rhizobium]ANK93808.1 hypothetical protein AMK01_PA00092 [Rhizobium sp. N6212]ANK99858.1 hypothetical protein AMK00_PA00092 [Rhizobium sp. N621]ANL05988.1 hypothetical protein AMJ99_PA00092 [Rhizobium esperanzae]ANL12153.1 hypothetical protein AMJ98_PB00092 [Rhizobium sp. N1341]ANL24114.1 hypothetical protein AMJ96_PA00092 [Rhizobium sp. N113]
MNARIRAKRILKDLRRYEAMPSPIWHQREEFGFLIGIYSNPGPSNNKIFILDNGIFWGDGGEGKSFLYSEVKLVSILEGQESVEIIILTDGGKELRIPVSGKDGKYSDCMVMLRFLDRVVADAKKYPYE